MPGRVEVGHALHSFGDGLGYRVSRRGECDNPFNSAEAGLVPRAHAIKTALNALLQETLRL